MAPQSVPLLKCPGEGQGKLQASAAPWWGGIFRLMRLRSERSDRDALTEPRMPFLD
jgi:hypothetical protein